MTNSPDFTYKPDPTIIQAFQNAQQQKIHREQIDRQKKQDEFKNLQDTTNAISSLVSNMVKAAETRKTNQIIMHAKDILSKPEPSATIIPEGPTLEGTTLPSIPNPELDIRNRARLDIAQALNPEDFGAQMAKQGMPGVEGKSVGRGFQQSGIQITDEQGRVKTVPVSYDTATGTYIHPLTKQPITDTSQLRDLPNRGYAQGFRSAGYTADGQEVVAEQRTGKKYVVDEDGEYQEFGGQIFAKKENLPAGLTESLSELEYSQQVLGRIGESFNPDFVGPIAATAGKMSAYLEALTNEQRVQFYGNMAEYKNSIIKAITGAQMSEVEAKRIIQQIPNENASPSAFKAGLKRAWRATNERIQTKVKGAEKGGYAYRGTPMTAEQAETLFNEKFGKLASPAIPEISIDQSALDAEIKKRGL